MGRLDFESGRFNADHEITEMSAALRGWQTEFGDNVLWYRYWREESASNSVFDESDNAGRIYHPAAEVPVLHVTHIEGGNENRAEGMYYNDELYITASFDELTKIGFTEMDLTHYSYLRDRIVYDFRVFRVTRMQIMGQVQRRDIMVSIEGTQVKPDEMLNDIQFQAFANPRFKDV